MAWTKIREVEANSNAYDRYFDATNGAAMVYRHDRQISGFANGVKFGPLDIPPDSNTQALRIRPESGAWYVYAWCDTDDRHRAEFRQAVAPL